MQDTPCSKLVYVLIKHGRVMHKDMVHFPSPLLSSTGYHTAQESIAAILFSGHSQSNGKKFIEGGQTVDSSSAQWRREKDYR